MKPRFGCALLALLFIAQGCGAGQRGYVPSPGTNDTALRPSASLPSGQLFVINAAKGHGSGSVAIFDLQTARLTRLLKTGVTNPTSIAADATGNLYVANAPLSGGGSIAVFSPGSSTPSSSITNGIDRPSDVKIDSAGELIVANEGNNTIAYYAPGGTAPLRTIVNNVASPSHIAFDPFFSVLWVLDSTKVTTYTPGTGSPWNVVRATFDLPSSMLLGSSDLYVANRLGGSGYGTIQGISLSTLKPTAQIVQDVHSPSDMAIDGYGRLYVANDFSPGSVTVYANGTNALQRKITAGISHPDAIALGGSGWLYVANDVAGHSNVAAYPPGKSSPAFELTEGVTSPIGLRIRTGPATVPSAVVFTVPGNASAITLGPDGNVWFVLRSATAFASGTLASIDQNGSVNALTMPAGYFVPDQSTLTRGPDGALWFQAAAEGNPSSSYTSGVGRIMPDGTGFAFFPLSGANYGLGEDVNGMTAGPDGAVWFTPSYTAAIDRITTSGTITSFTPPRGAKGGGIVTGPDGALWFTEPNNDRIARLATTGQFTEYKLPGVGRSGNQTAPSSIVVGPDGALWSIEQTTGKVVRITTSGKITTGPPWGRVQGDIAIGSDDGLWYSNGLGISSNSTKTLERTHELLLSTGGYESVEDLTSDSNGNVWFSVLDQSEVVRVTP